MPEKLPARALLDAWFARVGEAKPFLRWAGGKQNFLLRYADRLPEFTGNYLEPFLGSGSVFFALSRKQVRPFQARLGDTNQQLVRCFIAVRDTPELVAEQLAVLRAGYDASVDKAAFYYELRDAQNAKLPQSDPAAFIFLNRTCWNGLYRVNQKGHFNVPFAEPRHEEFLPSLEDLQNAAAALAYSHIRATSWENTVALAEPGDFVFLDPPYYSDVVADTAIKYRRRRFGLEEHGRLAKALSQLSKRGVAFVLTNSAELEMVELYRSHGLTVEEIQLPRPINSKPERRVPVPELVVTNGSPP